MKPDKKKHFYWSMGIAGVIYLTSSLLLESFGMIKIPISMIAGLGIALLIGLIKEKLDKIKDSDDIKYGMLGAFIGVMGMATIDIMLHSC